MYMLNKPLAILGAIIAALSTLLCPFVKVPIVGNWNMYHTDTVLFLTTLAAIGICILFLLMRRVSWYRTSCFILLAWCILGVCAVYFKVNHFFGLKLVDNLLGKTIQIQWGWLVLLGGVLLMTFSVRKFK